MAPFKDDPSEHAVQTLSKFGASHRVVAPQYLCALILASLLSTQSSAKGGGMHSEDRYNPQHINSLPPEIRNAIYRRSSTAGPF